MITSFITRAPLSPNQVRSLVDTYGFKVLIQSCSKRIFSNQEYVKAGAFIQEDLSNACLILGLF